MKTFATRALDAQSPQLHPSALLNDIRLSNPKQISVSCAFLLRKSPSAALLFPVRPVCNSVVLSAFSTHPVAEKGHSPNEDHKKHPSGAEARTHFMDLIGTTEVVPLLQNGPKRSFSAACQDSRCRSYWHQSAIV
jgi:hypothetical protein